MTLEELQQMDTDELEELQMHHIERIENNTDENRIRELEKELEMIESEIHSRKQTKPTSFGLLKQDDPYVKKSTGLLLSNSAKDNSREKVQEKIQKYKDAIAKSSQGNEKYLKYVKKAAYLGDAKSCYDLARCYELGSGISKDHKMAFRFYQRAFQLGFFEAGGKVAYFYEKGMGTGRDYSKAEKIYQLAHSKGHMQSGYMLARLYESGKLGEEKIKKAIEIYYSLSSGGDNKSTLRLAHLYEYGKGANKNIRIAQGYYEEVLGKATGKDLKEARREYRKFLYRNNLK